MSLYRFYIFVLSLSPFMALAIVLSDFWGVVGFWYKLNRLQRRWYAKYRAWNFTRTVYRELWHKSPKKARISREAFYWTKRWGWNEMYQRKFEAYRAEAEQDKHPLERAYEDRQQYEL